MPIFGQKNLLDGKNSANSAAAVGKGKGESGFTLVELVSVIALLSMLLVFLLKLNVSSQDAHQAVQLAIKMLAASLDNVRAQAIGGNHLTALAIDIASTYKFRRIALYGKKRDGSWAGEQVLLLPERTSILGIGELSRYLDDQDLSAYAYVDEKFPINGEAVDCYPLIFDGEGVLCNMARNCAIIAVGYDVRPGERVGAASDSAPMGLLIVPTGQRVILASKSAMKEAL
jgi:prepilin-type N-terminal cleavage/methylation domain-containing protein